MRSPASLSAFVVIWLLIVTDSAGLLAQIDRRVSPPDPLFRDLTPASRIEAAGRIGDFGLVVWGTNRRTGSGEIVGALAGRVVVGTNVFPVFVHSSEARPDTVVSVLVSGEHFVVVWNDSRIDAPGFYMRRIHRFGEPVGPEIRLLDRRPVDDLVHLAGIGPDGSLLVTEIARPDGNRVLLWRLDSLGAPIGSVDTFATGSIAAVHQFLQLPGLTVLQLGDSSAFVIRAGGHLDRRNIGERFSVSSWLSSDTSLVELHGSRVRIYANLFDALPASESVLPALDSALPGTTAVAATPWGDLKLAGIMAIQSEGNLYRIPARILTTTRTGEVLADTVITAGLYGADPPCYIFRSDFVSAAVHRTCDNQYRVRACFDFGLRGRCPMSATCFGYDIRPDGTIHAAWQGLPTPLTCSRNGGSITVVRTSSDSSSAVRLSIGGYVHTLAVPLETYSEDQPERTPGLFADSGGLGAVWGSFPRTGYTFASARWDRAADRWTLLPPATGLYEPRPSGLVSGLVIRTETDHQYGVVHQQPRTALLTYHVFRSDVVRVTGNTSSLDLNVHTTALRFFLPSLSGLRLTTGWAFSNDYVTYVYTLESVASVPGARQLISSTIETRTRPGPRDRIRTVTLFDREGSPRQSFPNLLPDRDTLQIVPLDSAEYLAISERRAAWMKGGEMVSEFLLDTTYATVRYHPLMFRRMLRIDRDSSDSSRVALSLITIDARRRLVRTLMLSSTPRTIAICQNPSSGMIALIWSGDSGLRATFLDPYTLASIADDVALSEMHAVVGSPAGLFLRDTLHTIWEESRNGGADVYASATAAPAHAPFLPPATDLELGDPLVPVDPIDSTLGMPSALNPSVAPPRLQVYPNPARHGCTLGIELTAAGEVGIELFDSHGERLFVRDLGRRATGSISVDIAFPELPSGTYSVVVTAGGSRSAVRLAVAGE